MKKLITLLFLICSLFASSQQIVTLDGSASTDVDGTIVKWRWKQISGPAPTVILDSTAKITTVSIPYVAGDYVFQLTVTDDDGAVSLSLPASKKTVHVLPNPDLPPATNAGPDQNLTLPLVGNKFTLTGSATDVNGNGTISSYSWTIISGPVSVVIMASNAAVTDVTNVTVAGDYKFRLKVIDIGGASSADTVLIHINSANQLPTSNAGSDQIITLPANSVVIGAVDASGLSIQWMKISGPNGGTISLPQASITQVTNLPEGSFIYRKIVTNSFGSNYDDVNVTVNKAISCSFWDKLFRRHGCHF